MDLTYDARNQSRWPFAASLIALLVVSMAVLMRLDSEPRLVLLRTLMLGLSASLVAVPIGVLICWVCRGSGVVSRLLMLFCLVSVMLPIVVHVSSWDAAFGKLGWLTATTGGVLKPILGGWWAAVWVHGIIAAPQVGLLLLLCGDQQQRAFEEQAKLDTGPWTVFFRVTLWRFVPLVVVAVLWTMTTCCREIAVTDLYQVGTLAEQVYLGYSLDSGSIIGAWSAEQLAAAGQVDRWLVLATVLVFGLVATVLLVRLTALSADGSFANQSIVAPSVWRSAVGWLLLTLLVLVPVSNVLARSCFFVQPTPNGFEQKYSILQAWHAIQRASSDYDSELVWSTLIGVVAATVTVIVATASTLWAMRGNLNRIVFVLALAFFFALPGPVIGSWLSTAFASVESPLGRWLIDYTIFGPVIATTLFVLPMVVLLVWLILHRGPRSIHEAAQTEGADQVTRVWRLEILANWRMLFGCWVLAFALSFGELSASQMVRPAGMDTVARKMLGDLHAGVNELTAGITIVVTGIVIVVSCLGWLVIGIGKAGADR
jgi:iron(III) transport system permease protein